MAHTCGYVHLKTQLGWSPGQGEESSPTLQRPPPPCRDATLTLPAASGDMGRSLGSSLLSHSGQEIFAWKEMTARAKIATLGSPLRFCPHSQRTPSGRAEGLGGRAAPKAVCLFTRAPKIPFQMQPPGIFFPKASRTQGENKSESRPFELKKITFILGTNKIMVNIYK